MITGIEFAEQARSASYNGITYDQLDCQGWVERVAKDAGIRKPNGSSYNWKGSNDMWRNIPGWKGPLDECRTVFGEIPLGAWVFIRRTDGGEKDRGYNDNLGNFTHVGIYCRTGMDPVRDSTRYSSRDGVGYRQLKSFTHVLLPDFINYTADQLPDILKDVKALRNSQTSDKDWIKALENIIQYLKGV